METLLCQIINKVTYFITTIHIRDGNRICELIEPTKVANNSINFKERFFINNINIKGVIKSNIFNLITSQYLDPYGKCRIISIRYKEQNIYAYTFLPTLNNIIMNNETTIENDIKILYELFEEFNIKIKSQYVS